MRLTLDVSEKWRRCGARVVGRGVFVALGEEERERARVEMSKGRFI